ncbi:hypothetical protein LZ31DRAFT_282512 [Colletotrichum somersetense]|nr:hypothetical protein LZ31DRAFT_282512 [Colletotrichum somersetense]
MQPRSSCLTTPRGGGDGHPAGQGLLGHVDEAAAVPDRKKKRKKSKKEKDALLRRYAPAGPSSFRVWVVCYATHDGFIIIIIVVVFESNCKGNLASVIWCRNEAPRRARRGQTDRRDSHDHIACRRSVIGCSLLAEPGASYEPAFSRLFLVTMAKLPLPGWT